MIFSRGLLLLGVGGKERCSIRRNPSGTGIIGAAVTVLVDTKIKVDRLLNGSQQPLLPSSIEGSQA